MTHQPPFDPEGLPPVESFIPEIEAERLAAEARRAEAAKMAQAALEQERQAKADAEQRRVRMAGFFRADARHTADILNRQGIAPAQGYGPDWHGVPPLWRIATTRTLDWITPSKWVVTEKGGPMVTTYRSTRSDDMSRDYNYPDKGYWTEPVSRHAEELLGLSQDGQVHFVRIGDEPELVARSSTRSLPTGIDVIGTSYEPAAAVTGSRLRLATDDDIWTLMSQINSGRSLDNPAVDPTLVVGWRRLLAGVVMGAQGVAGTEG